jgi:hypothetical protein
MRLPGSRVLVQGRRARVRLQRDRQLLERDVQKLTHNQKNHRRRCSVWLTDFHLICMTRYQVWLRQR